MCARIRETDHHGKSAGISLLSEDLVIEVHQVDSDENLGINHIGWYTTPENIEKISKNLTEKNIAYTGSRFFESTRRILLNFRDPNGVRA